MKFLRALANQEELFQGLKNLRSREESRDYWIKQLKQYYYVTHPEAVEKLRLMSGRKTTLYHSSELRMQIYLTE